MWNVDSGRESTARVLWCAAFSENPTKGTGMERKDVIAAAEAYWDENRDAIVADIAKLV